MRCPKCQNRPATFIHWLRRPGPTRTCESCGSHLRYRNFNVGLVAHALLGGTWVMLHLPLWGFVVVLPLTAVIYPWWFAHYDITA